MKWMSHMNESQHPIPWHEWVIWMSHVTYINQSHPTWMCRFTFSPPMTSSCCQWNEWVIRLSLSKLIGLFCKRAHEKRRYSAKETWNEWVIRLSLSIPLPHLHETHCTEHCYEVATISRLLKMIGRFCKRAHEKRRYSAKETYNFKDMKHTTQFTVMGWLRLVGSFKS